MNKEAAKALGVTPYRTIDFLKTEGDVLALVEAVRASALEEAAQLCEAHIREYRDRAEDGDYFEALPGKIRGL